VIKGDSVGKLIKRISTGIDIINFYFSLLFYVCSFTISKPANNNAKLSLNSALRPTNRAVSFEYKFINIEWDAVYNATVFEEYNVI
jgi:hypothetical protein